MSDQLNLREKIARLLGSVRPGKAGNAAQVQHMASEWDATIIAGMTPTRMAAMMKRSAEAGATSRPGEDIGRELEGFFTFAAEIEELDPHYRSVLSTRKLAISGLEPDVTASSDNTGSSDNTSNNEIVGLVSEVIEAPAFADLIVDLLDGLGKGFSVVDPVWDVDAQGRWIPVEYVWQDQRAYMWDRHERRVALRPVSSSGKPQPLQPGHSIVHVPKLISGNPVRGALARVVAWSFLFKNYTIKDWMRFLEVYGMPLRIGKYGTGATEDDKRTLLRALMNLGSDAAAAVPQGMDIELIQATSGSSSAGPVFGHMADYLDKQISKAVVGQTMTSDDGSSRSQAEVHNEVRDDIKRADARQLTATITRDLITPLVIWNFGANAELPKLALPVPEPEDLKLWTESVTTFMDRGLQVSRRQVQEKFALDDPDGENDVLSGRKATSPDKPSDGDAGKPDDAGPDAKPPAKKAKASAHGPACPCCAGKALAASEDMDELDQLVALAIEQGGDDLDGLVEPVLKAARAASSFDDFARRLSGIAGEMDAGAFISRLGTLTSQARGLGDTGDEP